MRLEVTRHEFSSICHVANQCPIHGQPNYSDAVKTILTPEEEEAAAWEFRQTGEALVVVVADTPNRTAFDRMVTAYHSTRERPDARADGVDTERE